SGYRADQARLLSAVAERSSELDDEVREICVGDERIRPDPIVDVGLRQGLGPTLEQSFQQDEGLRRDGQELPAPEYLPGVRVEEAIPEAQPHRWLATPARPRRRPPERAHRNLSAGSAPRLSKAFRYSWRALMTTGRPAVESRHRQRKPIPLRRGGAMTPFYRALRIAGFLMTPATLVFGEAMGEKTGATIQPSPLVLVHAGVSRPLRDAAPPRPESRHRSPAKGLPDPRVRRLAISSMPAPSVSFEGLGNVNNH